MKIGIATPVSLRLLERHVERGTELPTGYEFPLHAILIEEYLRRGHQISLFTTDRTICESKTFWGNRLTIHIMHSRLQARHRMKDFFAAERAGLIAAMKSDPCDIVHAHWTYEFALAAIASGQPYVVTAHDAPLQILRLTLRPYKVFAYRFIRTLMAIEVARRARYLTAVSPYVARHFRKILRYPNPIEVIPNGLPESAFVSRERKQGGGESEVTFATVLTGWGRYKNGQVALRSFEHVRKVVPQARLLMFGWGHGEGEEAWLWARERGMSEGVEFVGSVPHPLLLERLDAEVDVLVHPSLQEAHPVSVVEAMALGIAVIGGTHSGGVPFTLENGKAGLLVDVRSPQEVAQAMLRLAKDPETRLALGKSAYESAWRRFRIESVVDAYEETYDEVLMNFARGKA